VKGIEHTFKVQEASVLSVERSSKVSKKCPSRFVFRAVTEGQMDDLTFILNQLQPAGGSEPATR